jgi:Gly-Xaa carboxypeptidase
MIGLALLGLVPSALALNIPTQQILFPGKATSHNEAIEAVEPASLETCPQASKVAAPYDGFHSSLTFLKDEAFRARQAQRLSRAVQVPTTVGDYATDPYDEAFEPVVQFQKLLEQMFPLV